MAAAAVQQPDRSSRAPRARGVLTRPRPKGLAHSPSPSPPSSGVVAFCARRNQTPNLTRRCGCSHARVQHPNMDGSSDRDTVLMTCHVVLPGDSTQNDLFFSVERGTELSLTETAGHNEAFELVLTDTFFSLRTFNSPHLYVCAGGTEEEDATLSAGGSPGELFVLSKPTDSDNGRICLQLAPSASRSATPRFLAVQQDRVIVARKGLGNPFLQLTRVKDLQLEGWKRNWDRAVRKRAVTLSAASAVAGSTSTITSLSSADSESVEGDASSRCGGRRGGVVVVVPKFPTHTALLMLTTRTGAT